MLWHEVKFQPEQTQTFIGSPGLARLPDGVLVASHDYFGPGCPRTCEGEEGMVSIYRSEDNGQSWVNVTHVMNAFWSALFYHQGSLYLIGTSQQWGSIVIRRSNDGGFTWTHPTDSQHGLLFKGGAFHNAPNYHCAPTPVLVHGNRLYRAFENCDPLEWGPGFKSLVISVGKDGDLLDAGNWSMSNQLAFDPAWLPKEWGDLARPGWLEGNMVTAPSGELWNVLRFHANPVVGKVAIVKVHDDGARLIFNPTNGFIEFPGGATKFTIRRDPKSQKYLALVNNVTDARRPDQRNVLSLSISTDLMHWKLVKTLMVDDTGLGHEDSIHLTGFQYVEWHFDGNDIIYLIRAAYRGARNFHDANRLIFARLINYADYM